MIRDAVIADVPDILRMIHELAVYEQEPDAVHATAEDLHASLFAEQPLVNGIIAEHEGRAVGFVLWFVTFSTWQGRHGAYVEDLYVEPAHRGSGFGKQLLKAVAKEAVQRGYGRLEWSVLDWNTPAIGFYTSLGAVALDEWTRYRVSDTSLANLAQD
jgi:GNAT superfamily N-acetyltransferase